VPFKVNVNEPVLKLVGATLVRFGVTFHSVTALDALTLEFCTEVTPTLTVFGFGNMAGATYAPVALIVPIVALPPLMPLTVQVTFWLVALVSCAVNACDAPARTFALVGLRVMLSCGGGGGGGGGFCFGPVPAQPTSSSKSIRAKAQDADARLDNGISSWA
jgi:hypothetical protein